MNDDSPKNIESSDDSSSDSSEEEIESKSEKQVEISSPESGNESRSDVPPSPEIHKDQEQLDFEAEEKEPSESGEASEGEGSDKEEGEEVEKEELEEGEVTDDDDFGKTARMEPRALCKFFTKGQCTWGINCRFLHPGVSDKGNYSMFSTTVKPVAVPGSKPLSEMAPVWEDAMPPPPPVIPVEESPWEKAMREAKERLKKAHIRRETDEEFEEKKFNLGLGDLELEKEADYYARVPSPPRNDFDDLRVIIQEEEEEEEDRDRLRRPPPPPPNPYEDYDFKPTTGLVEIGRYEDPRRFRHRGHYDGGGYRGYRHRGDMRNRGSRYSPGRDRNRRDRSYTPRKSERRRSYSSGSSYSSSSSRSRSSSYSGSSSRSSSRSRTRSPSPRRRRGPAVRGGRGGRGGRFSPRGRLDRRSISPRPPISRRPRSPSASSRSSSRSRSQSRSRSVSRSKSRSRSRSISRSYSPRAPSRRLPPSSGHSKLSAQAAANQANLAAAAAAAISKKGVPLPKPAKTIAAGALPAEAPKAPVRLKLNAAKINLVAKPGKFVEDSSEEEEDIETLKVAAAQKRQRPASPSGVSRVDEITRKGQVTGKKRVAQSPPPSQPKEKVVKESVKEKEKDRRRDELMRQLKAVEEAIAKKRTKIT
ncbi:zinc finger CCCH domain-containing protein 18-like [Artemia franciscana]|uniref:zinc finger CCCH domain-containing protein 18-like n=1 Tax=Artemia franciscana TaxID=6661 RepID=UPI0032DB8426